MYNHEKALFEVATLDTKTYLRRRYTYVVMTLIIVCAMLLFTSIALYLSVLLVIPMTSGVFIEKYIQKRKCMHKDEVKNQFIQIFYPSMIANHSSLDPCSFEKDHHTIKNDIQTSEMYQDLKATVYTHFTSGLDRIAITTHHIHQKKKSYRVFISSVFDNDDTVEMRSFLKPKQPYVFKESVSGFQMYAQKKEHMQTYKKIFEKLRVIKDIDQLDVKITNGRMCITYKIHRLVIPNVYQSNDKSILSHENFIKHHISTYQAITHTLKESTHAYRK
jgi:hypothetical protein